MALAHGLMVADIFHKRLHPKEHALSYKVYYLCLPLSRLAAAAGRVLKLGRFGLMSFQLSDYGFGDKGEAWARGVLKQYQLGAADGELVLVTMPRILGYGFNPVSFWFCLGKDGALRAVISEVNNTFGERHAYISFHDDHRPITKDDVLTSRKIFHVSPFMKVEGHYEFRFAYGEEKIGVWIDYFDNHQKMLITSVVGKRTGLDDKSLLVCFFTYPLVTLKVIVMIHLHALRLVIRGIQYHIKPEPPAEEISR